MEIEREGVGVQGFVFIHRFHSVSLFMHVCMYMCMHVCFVCLYVRDSMCVGGKGGVGGLLVHRGSCVYVDACMYICI